MTELYEVQERASNDIKEMMHPLVREWFFSKYKDFSLTQKYGVMSIWERKDILISAPTGGTKTLTAFLSILNYLVTLAEKNELEDKIYALYTSPLKALTNDIHKNLVEPLEEIQELAKKKKIKLQKIRVGLRTGDTTASERAKMARKPPHIFVTTPESLAIILTTKKFVENLRYLEFCVVDEIHALENKRGTYLSLTLERLNEVSFIYPVKIGLSATIEPLDEVAKFLTGIDKERSVGIAKVPLKKTANIKVLTPVKDLVEEPNVYPKMYALLDKLIQEHQTTLVFTNTRSATERVVNHLKEKFPTIYGDDNIAAHHSSLSKEHRFNIEERLRNGKLKVVVCSTSLELGIDIGYIDLVLMLGSPKSSARALQRCLSYDSLILCLDGSYKKIGDIVKNKEKVRVISYDNKKGFVKNKICQWHENDREALFNIKLKTQEEIKCTKEHRILTKNGWKKAKELKKGDFIAEIKNKINFDSMIPYFYEFLPQDKIFVVNQNNFFQKIVDNYRRRNNFNVRKFAEFFDMPYFRFVDCRRIKGRKKSIRLDYFLRACKLCNVSDKIFLPYLSNLKTKGMKWPKYPLKVTKDLMWLTGIIATDGCIVKSKKDEIEYYKIKIGNKSVLMIDKIKEIVKDFDIYPYVVKKEIYHLEFGSNLLAYFFMSLGIPCKNKSFDLRMSNKLFSLPKELLHAYLEGILEGDGSINIKKSNMMRIFTASKQFALGLHRILSRLGYKNKVSKNKIKPSKLIKKVSDNYLYCIGIYSKGHLKNFFKKCLGYGERARKGKHLTSTFSESSLDDFLDYSEIEKINLIEKEKTYNLTLEDPNNNFIVGNIIVHNCGRAGHKLHETAKGRFIVSDRDDLIECSVIQKEMIEHKINKITFPKNALDVLAQQIYGMAIYKVWKINEIFELIRKSYCYSKLTKNDFYDIISYLSGEYSLEKNFVYGKIWYDKDTREIGKRGKMARVLYMTNIGTIPEESFVTVKLAPSGTPVGVIDESFLGRMKKGDVFVLGGVKYQYAYTRGMNLYVRGDVRRPPTIPSWFSEMLPLSFDSANEINRFRKLIKDRLIAKQNKDEIIQFIEEYLYTTKSTATAIYNYMNSQYRFLEIPTSSSLIIERYKGDKNYLIFHSMFGRRVNDALSRAIAYMLATTKKRDVEIGISDNGFFLAGAKVNIDAVLNKIKTIDLDKILKEAINKTDVLSRRFRHCATRALMILRSYKGRRKTVGKQQMKSHFLINAVKKISNEFPILREARREVLEDLMDIENTKRVLSWIKDGSIKIKVLDTPIPSPFALNLVIQGHSDLIKLEDKQEFLRRMHALHMKRVK